MTPLNSPEKGLLLAPSRKIGLTFTSSLESSNEEKECIFNALISYLELKQKIESVNDQDHISRNDFWLVGALEASLSPEPQKERSAAQETAGTSTLPLRLRQGKPKANRTIH